MLGLLLYALSLSLLPSLSLSLYLSERTKRKMKELTLVRDGVPFTDFGPDVVRDFNSVPRKTKMNVE